MYMLIIIYFLTLLQTNLAAHKSACELYKTRFRIAITNSKGRLFCGGSLINSRWVLTAAACKKNFALYASDVFNSAKFGNDEVVSWWAPVTRVSKIYLHPEYIEEKAGTDEDDTRSDDESSENDIALMKLQNGMDETRVNFVKLPFSVFLSSESTEFCPTAATVGWSRQDGDHSEGTPTHLQCAELKTISHADCSKIYTDIMGVNTPNELMCIANLGENKFCVADQGSPLMCGDVQYGILDEGIECGEPYPTRYTRVDHYLSFIHEHLYPSELRSTHEGLYHSKLLIIVFTLIKKMFS